MPDNDYFSKLRLEFDNYYYQKLWPKLLNLEENRLKQLHRFWILFFIMCFALPCFIIKMWGEWLYLIFTQGSSQEIEGIIKLGALLFIVILAVVSYPIISYETDVKSSIIDDFANFFGNFKHYFARKIDDEIIKKSLLFGNYNRHSGDDFFEGQYKNVKMIISEEEMYIKHNKGQTNVFEGIVILLDFPRSFKGQTVVFKDWGIFNFMHKKLRLENIKLEDVIFEKEFEVYGTDQIEARYLLTTAFMERILMVREAFKSKKIQFSFFDNRLFIAINTTTDMFEPASLFKRSTDRRPIDKVLEQFISVFSIVEFLKLTQQ